ncbi:MAG TPA: hypothetical protein VFH92_02480, partial [Phenylobacterium sp.]|nr:hypothetical protein [Phenylobacterium sp.]
MKRLALLAACAAAFALPAVAQTVGPPDPARVYQSAPCQGDVGQACYPVLHVTWTNRGGTVTSGGTAQNAMSANSSRKGWCVQNDPAATENLTVRADGTASATDGTVLQAGQQVCNVPGMTSVGAV